MDKLSLIELRPHRKTDEPFIYATWMRGLKHANDVYKQIDKIEYDRGQRKVIETILKIGTVMIAALKEDPDVILGYSVTRNPIIDWVFVKMPWRRLGLATELLKHLEPQSVSHITYVGNSIRLKKNLKFDPYK